MEIIVSLAIKMNAQYVQMGTTYKMIHNKEAANYVQFKTVSNAISWVFIFLHLIK